MEPVLYLRIVKSIIGFFGMIGNTLVCLVIHQNQEMHTLTNALIFNQAVIDFLSCIFIFLHSNIPDSGPPSHHDTPLDQRSTGTTPENRSINTHPESLQESIKRARRNVFKTLVLVFAAFVVCWTPNQFAFLFYNLGYNITLGSIAYRITILMAQSNSAVNFFVYGFKYKQFRRGLRKLFRCPISIEPQTGSAYINSAT
ncbi:galanin receptor 2b-like [Amphiura filiformis]|uniref:galanin receptor 2b-like n=1 Tax=Amphiura filiformis TaxID=82378 RepID=UPI003B2202D3